MEGGLVVVTRFECPNRFSMLELLWLHRLLRRRCRKQLSNLIDVKAFVSWHERLVLSVSLWSVAEGVMDMGSVDEHVRISRIPSQRGIVTSGGVFQYAGDWRDVMFGADVTSVSPLR